MKTSMFYYARIALFVQKGSSTSRSSSANDIRGENSKAKVIWSAVYLERLMSSLEATVRRQNGGPGNLERCMMTPQAGVVSSDFTWRLMVTRPLNLPVIGFAAFVGDIFTVCIAISFSSTYWIREHYTLSENNLETRATTHHTSFRS